MEDGFPLCEITHPPAAGEEAGDHKDAAGGWKESSFCCTKFPVLFILQLNFYCCFNF